MKIIKQAKFITIFIFLIFIFSATSRAQTTAFTYQGKLNDGALPANGNYLLEFKLYDTQTVGTGTQIGAAISDVSVTVANGVFTVQLDFGADAFNGADRFLEISVRRNASENYVTLSPRQPFSSAPYAIKSKTAETAVTATNATNATNAVNADTLDGIDSTGFVPSNTTLFIRNQTNQQSSSNFNVSGTGTANILNATTQFNYNGTRILGYPGGNLSVGNFAGNASATGNGNSFFGTNAGNNITTGTYNSFVGILSGFDNTTGDLNAFVGAYAGFGNTTGDQNSFFGAESGNNNTIGTENSFIGTYAGYNNTTGNQNSFVGNRAGNASTTGSGNSFFGMFAGITNTTGNRNTIIGYDADVNVNNLSYATAIGAESTVTTSNTIALGRSSGADRVLAYGLLQVNTLGAAGATTLCRNASNQISTCSSSLRYKTNINSFDSGLRIINRLRPITFDWKDGGMKDLGLGAEDVAEVDENLVIRNDKGEVEGVKYDRLGVVLINAVREQQSQIQAQQKLIESQAKQIELLTRLVCAQNTAAEICRGEK